MKLNQYGFPDRTFVEKILNTPPIKFDHVIAIIQQTKDLEHLSIEDLHGLLILHEQRIIGKLEDTPEKDTVEKALQTQLNLRSNSDVKEQGESSQRNPSYNNRGDYNNRGSRGNNNRDKGGTSNPGCDRGNNFNFRGGPDGGRNGNFGRENNFNQNNFQNNFEQRI